jgi:hypothetical protein
MKIESKILLAAALAVSFAAPVMAAENEDTEGMIYEFLSGKMYKAHVSEDAMHGMMSHFRQLRNGTMIYSRGGHFYIAEDRKMSNGKMLSSMIFGEDLAVSSQH